MSARFQFDEREMNRSQLRLRGQAVRAGLRDCADLVANQSRDYRKTHKRTKDVMFIHSAMSGGVHQLFTFPTGLRSRFHGKDIHKSEIVRSSKPAMEVRMPGKTATHILMDAREAYARRSESPLLLGGKRNA